VHAAALESGSDGDLATSLDYARGRAKPFGFELWIAHTIPAAVQVLKTLAGLVTAVRMTAHRSEQIIAATGIEFFMTALRPILGLGRLSTVEHVGQLTHMFFDMEPVHNLYSPRE
jgi:hypothetical protein